MAPTKRIFEKAMRGNDLPEKIERDKSRVDKTLIDESNNAMTVPIMVREVKYLNNIEKQDHRAIKRVTRHILRFKQPTMCSLVSS